MKKISIVLLSIGVLLVGCDKKEEETNANVCDIDLTCNEADMSAYEGFNDKEHVFLEIDFEKANAFLQQDDFNGIMYFGYPNCPWCLEALPIMNEVAKEKKLSIYYVDKKSEINKQHPQWEEETIKYLDAAYGLQKDDHGDARLYVPEVIVVKDGMVVAHHMGTLNEHDATKNKMNEAQQSELKKIYEEMFSKLI